MIITASTSYLSFYICETIQSETASSELSSKDPLRTIIIEEIKYRNQIEQQLKTLVDVENMKAIFVHTK
ncbi:hypothetical protein I4U23_017565 [Adineta vaga]|nr:hypothetical protein I4U23_017565 [Adineta vaga]